MVGSRVEVVWRCEEMPVPLSRYALLETKDGKVASHGARQ